MIRRGHIWMFTRSLPAHTNGGMERVARDTCAGLAARGWEIDLVTNRLPGPPDLSGSVRIHALDAPPGVYSRVFRRGIVRWAAEQKRKPDLIFSVSMAASPLITRFPHTPSIFQAHGSSWREFVSKTRSCDPRGLYRLGLYLRDERRTLSRYGRIVAVGPAVYSYLTSFPYGFLDREKIVLIQNGIDTAECARAMDADREETRERFGVPPGNNLIACACRMVRVKGIFHLVRGYERMPEREKTTLVIAGEGRDRTALEAYCRQRGLSDVKIVGGLKHEAVVELLASSDLLVQLSICPEAGLPLVVLEALCTGCPVLLSDHISIPGFERSNAILSADPNDPEAVARSIGTGLGLGAPQMQSAETAQTLFSSETMIDRYEEVIESILRK